jgi:phosphate transport system substrate-binding protein
MLRRKWLGTVLLVGVAGTCGCGGSRNEVKLSGAGASFPAPLYTKWFKDFGAAHPEVRIDYQSIGSGAGKKAILDETVDFGASDAAMDQDEIAKVKRGVVLLPMTAGSIVLAYNLEGVDNLKLSRAAYSGIFLGTITKWNDPVIAKDNKGTQLPDSPINVVVRSDSSGTTYVFTKHLSEINKEFAKSPGTNTMPNWPVGTKSKGNEGVTASIKTTPGSIGYIEYGYAMGTKLPTALLENHDHNFVKATPETGKAALDSTELPADLIAWNPDPVGKDAYPIVTFTWMIFYKHYDDAKKATTLKDVVEYGLTKGQADAEPLGYIPLPERVVNKNREASKQIGAGTKTAGLTPAMPGRLSAAFAAGEAAGLCLPLALSLPTPELRSRARR